MKLEDALGKDVPIPDWNDGKGRIYKRFVFEVSKRGLEIEGDSIDYEVLWNAARKIKGVPGLVLELGVRRGMGIFTMINACLSNDDPRKFFGVDCYGTPTFPNDMKRLTKRNLAEVCWRADVEFTMLELDDIEFFRLYRHGIPTYDNLVMSLVNEYAMVHLDGPHRKEDVVRETEFFLPRIPRGGVIVYDDVNKPKKYRHSELEPDILAAGFEVLERKHAKVAYIRTTGP